MKPAAFVSIGECMIELSAGKGDAVAAGLRRRHLQHRLVCARHPAEGARGRLCHRARRRPVLAPHDGIHRQGRRRDRPHPRQSGAAARPLRHHAGEGGARPSPTGASQSAARLLADDPAWLAQALADAEFLYFSGITLAILAPAARRRLLAALEAAAAGRRDDRLRPEFPLRCSGRTVTRQAKAMQAAYRVADIALPTFSDEAELFGDRSIAETDGAAWLHAGVREFVIKNGDKAGARLRRRQERPRPADEAEEGGRHDRRGRFLRRRLSGRAAHRPAIPSPRQGSAMRWRRK